MQKTILLFSAALLSFLLLTLSTEAVYAAADIQPTSFLASPDPVPARGEVVYTIVVKSNDQADPVTNGWLEVPLPPNFSFLSVNDANCSYSGNIPSTGAVGDVLRCDWATITFQETVILTARVPDATGIYPLTATTGADVDSNPSNDSETVNTQVVTSADLQLAAKVGTPSEAPGGSIVTYDFSVINNGPYTASSLVLTDLLPPGLTFVSDNASPAADQDGDWNCTASGQNVTCTASSLAVSTTSIFHFRVRVTQAGTGLITNAASVNASTLDPIPDNNTATDDLTVVEGTDMAIAKSVITSPVIGGIPVRFSLTATNNGPMSAADVEVRDTLPSGYADITMVSTPAGWICSIEDPVIICTSAALSAGATANFVIEATPPTVTDAVVHQNSAQVATTTVDADNSNDNITVNYTVNPDIADLSITKTKGPDPVAQGSEITSTIVVRNNGPRPADPVQVVDVLSTGESYVDFSGSNWTCSHYGTTPGGTVTCDYSAVPLATGANTTPLVILTTATGSGTLTNNACTGGSGNSVAPDFGDSNTGNNCVGAGVSSTTERADLEVVKETTDSSVDPAENTFTYTITVTNAGPEMAESVDFRDTIPQYVAAGSGSRPATGLLATPSQGSCTVTNALVQCNLGDIPLGASVTVAIAVSRPMADGTRTNTASAYSLVTGDPNRSNNEDSVDVTVQPVTDIEVTAKAVTYAESPDPILAGTVATYTIQVRNNGPSTAENVTLADVFTGEAFAFIDAAVAGGGSCSYDAGATTLNCNLNSMAAATIKSITVRIRPDHNAILVGDWQIDNTATVSTDTVESNADNNEKSMILPVQLGEIDLAIVKNESPDFTEPVRFVPSGDNLIVYSIRISNSGPSLATGVTFTDNVRSVNPVQDPLQQLRFVRDTGNSDGTADGYTICSRIGDTFPVDGSDQNITCELEYDAGYPGGSLAAGASYTRYLVFAVLDTPDPISGDSYRNESSVTANEEELTPSNNAENENTTVRTIVDLELVKEGPTDPVEVGEDFDFTITVRNHGPGLSPETTVVDTLPTGMVLTDTPAPLAPAVGSCTGVAGDSSFTCDLGLMNNGDVVTISVPVRVTTYPSGGRITNTASVSGLGPEPLPDPHPNEDDADVDVYQPATLGDRVWYDRNANGVQNGGEPGLAGVIVRLLDAASDVVATTTTNSSGIYSFTINSAGTYFVQFFTPDDYLPSPKGAASATEATDSDADQLTGRTDAVTVDYGDAITTVDAGFYKLVSLGDRAWEDRNANGVQNPGEWGIPSVALVLYSPGDDNLFWTADDVPVATTTTDNNGFYLFSGLTPGVYAVEITPPAWMGYLPSPVQSLTPDNNINTDSNISFIAAAGVYRSGQITLSSGLEPTNDGDASNNTNLTLDFGLVLPGSIGNLVWLDENSDGIQDAGEPGIAGVVVQLKRATDGVVIATTVTDDKGGYIFKNLAPGQYAVEVDATTLPAGMSQTTIYPAAGTDMVNQNQSTGYGYVVSLPSSGENLSADFGYNWSPTADVTGGVNTGAIGDWVWIDTNGNGVQDNGEIGVAGVTVTLYGAGADGLFATADDVAVATSVTNASGKYIFDDLAAGVYVVSITDSAAASHDILDSSSFLQTGDPDHFAADSTTAPPATAGDHQTTLPIILAPGDTFVNADFGYQPQLSALLYSAGDTVWFDINRNGSKDPGESGVAGVSLQLSGEGLTATTTTGVDGTYLFSGLPEGTYTISVIDSDNILMTMEIVYDGDDGLTDPDQQSTFALSGADDLDQDFGYAPNSPRTTTGSIGDTVFLDRNGNGIADVGEGMEGIWVVLLDGSGNPVAGTFTDENGNYLFSGLLAGNYTVIVDTTFLPAGISNSVDPDGGGNSTSVVTLATDETINLDQDFGYVADAPGTIGNLVWKDTNADGVLQPDGVDGIPGTDDDESGLAGVSIDLYRDLDGDGRLDPSEPLLAGTVTDANGNYLFEGIPPGNYIVKVSDRDNVLEGFWHSLGSAGTDNNSQTDYYPLLLGDGETNLRVDFGYYFQPGRAGDRVWKDVDVDGFYAPGVDEGVADAIVVLTIVYPDGTVTTARVISDGDGLYMFHNLLLDENHNGVGSYGIGGNEPLHTIAVESASIVAPLVSIYPTRSRNTDTLTVGGAAVDEDDLDFGSDSPLGEQALPPMGGADITNDFGYFEPAAIGDFVWNDRNGNGIQDAGETGRQGVVVHLLDENGDAVDNPLLPGVPYVVPTDAGGNYLFTYLLPGNYRVRFMLPDGAVFTSRNSGGDDNLDSDPDSSGLTDVISLAAGERNMSIDAGLIGAAITVEKSTNGVDADSPPGVLVAAGSQVTWSYLVTNTGNTALTAVVVSDDRIGGISCPSATLAVGQSMTCTAIGTAVVGQYSNIGSVVASPPSGPAVFDSDPSHYLATADVPAIDIEKFTNGEDADTPSGPVVAVGDPVTWTYLVTNIGNAALNDVTVNDDQGVSVTCPLTTLAVGESMLCTATGVVQAGQYANIGTATAEPDGGGQSVTDSDPSHYFGSAGSDFAAISLEKSTNNEDADAAPGPTVEVGATVTWRYLVSNTGNTVLTNVTVSDDSIPATSINCPDDGNTDNVIVSLAPGASVTCVAVGAATIGQYANTGSVSGTPPTGPAVTDTDPSHYFGILNAITLEKFTNDIDADVGPGPYIEIGDTVFWRYLVSNTGNTDLTDVTVTDDRIAATAIQCPDDGNTDNIISFLAAGTSATCTATGTALAGQYANIGFVTGTPAIGAPVSDSDPSHYFGTNGSVTIEKATNGQDADTAPGPSISINGDVIWTYVVTNTGRLPLSNVIVSDDMGVAVSCPKDWLAIGESISCTGTGKAVKGQYANIGSVSAQTPLGGTLSDSDPSHYHGSSLFLLTSHLSIPQCPPTPDFCYLVADGDNDRSVNSALFKYTFKSNLLEMLGRLGVNNVEAIVLSPDGKTLYGADNGVFGRINTTPGTNNSFTPLQPGGLGKGRGSLGIIDLNDIDGLSFDPVNGKLYGTVRRGEGSDQQLDVLIQINPATGRLVGNAFGAGVDYRVITTGILGANDVDDIAIDSAGNMYGVGGNSSGGGGDNLLVIDKNTGAVLRYTALQFNGSPVEDMEGLTQYSRTTLYGTTGIEFAAQGTAEALYRIDIESGESTPVTRLDKVFSNGYVPYDFEAISCFPICR